MVTFIRQNHEQLLGIGEVGLDFWIVKEEDKRALQREIFTRFIDLSLELDLPLNVHSRSAGRHVIDLLLQKNARRVQLHAFDGKATHTPVAIEAGYYFSIPTSIVRSRQKQKLIKALPLTALLVETDSPVLGPHQDQRNEPVNIHLAVRGIAEIKELTIEEVIEATTTNAIRLYGEQILSESNPHAREESLQNTKG
jgi:TatD DNase family protein